LAASISETGGRLPGAKRIHPHKLGNVEIVIAEPVLKDLNTWCEKLGLANFA